MNQRMRLRLRPVTSREPGGKQHKHGREDSPAVPRRTRHPAQRVGQPGRDDEDGENLKEVGERRGVLEGMSAIGVEESAAIGARAS